jgi:hypothetical protein
VKFTKSVKNASVDSIAALRIPSLGEFVLCNTRNEESVLLALRDRRQLELVKTYRIPSFRAKCPCAMNDLGERWLWLCGSDMGDLIVCEQGEDPVILTMHEDAIVAVQWIRHTQMFLAADATGLVSFWRKTEAVERPKVVDG